MLDERKVRNQEEANALLGTFLIHLAMQFAVATSLSRDAYNVVIGSG